MARLTAATLQGIWAGVTLSWDDNWQFDEQLYRTNIERTINAGVHGIYTTGSTGEFYAIDDSEFRRMVEVQAELCGAAGLPLQIGCCADATTKVVRMLEFVARLPQIGAAQVVLPYWMELTQREVLEYFRAINEAAGDLPLVHYNIPRAKRFLNAEDYRSIREVAPNLIGVKFTFAGSHFGQLQECLLVHPDLSFFVAENLLVSAMMLGARGSYSSLIFTDPAFMLRLYAEAAGGNWAQALELQAEITRFLNDASAFIEDRGEGTIDPVFDKGLAVASGCVLGAPRTRPPYIGWSDETVSAMRSWLEREYPGFLHPDQRS